MGRQDIEGLTYHCLLHNREWENKTRVVGTSPGEGKRGNFLHSGRLRGRTKPLGKTMGNPLKDGQPPRCYFSDKVLVDLAGNQFTRFLFLGRDQLKLRGCARLNLNRAGVSQVISSS